MWMRMSPRAIAPAVIAAFALAAILPAAAQTPPAPSKSAPYKTAPGKAAPSKAPAPKEKAPAADPNVAEKEFTITAQNGTKIKVTVFPNLTKPGKIIRFDPYLPQTETNLFSASLNAMWEIFGRQRGAFTVQDGSLSTREGYPGSVVVYKLKTGAKFCAYPIRDEKSKSLVSMKVWME
jgi:hypothetical protein